MSERVSCPFKEFGLCGSSCPNYKTNVGMIEQVVTETNVNFRTVVTRLVFDIRTHIMVPVMKKYYPYSSVQCDNDIKH